MNRWGTYQKERFPLIAHIPLVAAFSYSALSYSSLLRGEHGPPPAKAALVAFLSSLLFFLELRIADEFKDFEEDSRYRPYRPVPRGLVTLKELGRIGVAAAVAQLLLALWLSPGLIPLLLITWTYLALMSCEFFARSWLKAHPFTYMWTHMLIMPQIDFYVTGCDWIPHVTRQTAAHSHNAFGAPSGLAWFLIISFFNGLVLEIGRKIRAPEDEEVGVETYTFLWGIRGGVRAWLIALALCAATAFMAARRIHFALPVTCAMIVVLCLAAATAAAFVKHPTSALSRRVEGLSGLWTLVMYLSLGAIPRLMG